MLFPLWHGKVATYRLRHRTGIVSGFRFGMVKLQPFVCQNAHYRCASFRFGMVKLQRAQKHRDDKSTPDSFRFGMVKLQLA